MPETLDRLSLLAQANGQQLPSVATTRGSEYDPDLESPTVLPDNPDVPSEESPLWRKPVKRRGHLEVAQVYLSIDGLYGFVCRGSASECRC